ncbi:MAG: cobyric acid synthase, partial [Verrucomicrobiota bacterium]
TTFHSEKEITQVKARWEDETWNAYEIHMGKSVIHPNVSPLLSCRTPPGEWRPEGCRRGNVGGTYLHGIFESAKFRQKMAQEAGISSHQISAQSWREKLDEIYGGMANLIEQHLNLEPIRSYVER